MSDLVVIAQRTRLGFFPDYQTGAFRAVSGRRTGRSTSMRRSLLDVAFCPECAERELGPFGWERPRE